MSSRGSTRRHTTRAALVCCALAASAIAGCGGGDPPPAAERPAQSAGKGRVDPGLVTDLHPNFVVFVTDDQTLEQFSPETMPRTWEYFERRGTRFTKAIVTSPLCCPARASMLSGQYAHNHGVLSNSYLRLRAPDNLLPLWLQRAGYRTAHVGKFLNNFSESTPRPERAFRGWDQWHTLLEPQRYFEYEIGENGRVVEYGSNRASYLTRVLNARGREMVELMADRRAPFYLQIDHYAPHTSGGRSTENCRGAAVPPERDAGLAEPRRVPSEQAPPGRRSFNERNVADKPSFIRRLPPLSRSERAEARQRHACALAALPAVDRGFEATIDALEAEGVLDETVVLFTSDNGYYFGEHRIPGEKHFPYDEGLRVPLAISLPESLVPERTRPKTSPAAVANIDIAPTILALADGRPCSARGRCRVMDGRSLLPLLAPASRVPGARHFAGRALAVELGLRGNRESYPRVCEFRGARTPRRVVVEHLSAAPARGDCRPARQLEHYELRRDPAQLRNLAAVGSGVSAQDRASGARLLRRARILARCSGVRGRDQAGRGRPFCE